MSEDLYRTVRVIAVSVTLIVALFIIYLWNGGNRSVVTPKVYTAAITACNGDVSCLKEVSGMLQVDIRTVVSEQTYRDILAECNQNVFNCPIGGMGKQYIVE